jgi:anti-sigma factor RsiW
MSQRDLACQEVVELVTDHLEGALPPGVREAFERHLAACGNCAAYLDQMRRTIAAAGRLREDELPVPVRDALVQAFEGWAAG